MPSEFETMVKKQEELEELKAKVRYLEERCPKVSSMQSSNGNDVPNQFIITTYGKTIFQSYNSVIAVKYSDGSVVLGEGIATTREKIANGTYTIDRSL